MGPHAEDLPGMGFGDWMFDEPKLKQSTAEEWRGFYETKCRELRKENEHLQSNLRELIKVAHKYGWNGVENSKILWQFFDDELEEKKKLQESMDQVDDVLIVNWVGPRKDGDYRKALNDLVDFNIKIELDPCVSKSAQDRLQEISDLWLQIETLKAEVDRLERLRVGF